MRYTIYCNEIEISDYVKSVSSSIEFLENRYIGNAPSECFTIELDNSTSFFNDKLNSTFTMYKNDVLFKTLKVYERPEKVFKDLKLTLYDSMVEMNIPYDTDINTYPKSLRSQLDEMSALTGVQIDYSELSIDVLNREINFYDNTELIRSYLRWIAELTATNVFSLADGTVKFIPFKKDVQMTMKEHRYVYEFETEEVFVCSGIKHEYYALELGSNDNHVYLVNTENPYISTTEDLQAIFSVIQGTTFTSVKNLKMRFLDGLQLGNKVSYEDTFDFIPFNMEITYHNGELSHDVVIIGGQFSSEAQEEFETTPTLKERIKRVEINVNQNETYLDIVAQTVDEQSEQIGKLLISNEQIQTKVEEVEKRNSVATITPQYAVTTNKDTTPTDGQWLESKPDMNVGEYLWMREKYTYQDGTIEYNLARVVSGQDGEAATLVRVDSSRGTMFKNNNISTVLTAVIYYGSKRVEDITALHEIYGQSAYIEWSWQRLDEDRYGILLSTDTRIQNDGFSLVLGPEDVDVKVTFRCELKN